MWTKLAPRYRKRSWRCSRDLASTELRNCHYEVSWDHSELLTPNIAEIRGWQRRRGLGTRGICYVYLKKYQDLRSRNMPINLPFSIYFLVFIIRLIPKSYKKLATRILLWVCFSHPILYSVCTKLTSVCDKDIDSIIMFSHGDTGYSYVLQTDFTRKLCTLEVIGPSWIILIIWPTLIFWVLTQLEPEKKEDWKRSNQNHFSA